MSWNFCGGLQFPHTSYRASFELFNTIHTTNFLAKSNRVFTGVSNPSQTLLNLVPVVRKCEKTLWGDKDVRKWTVTDWRQRWESGILGARQAQTAHGAQQNWKSIENNLQTNCAGHSQVPKICIFDVWHVCELQANFGP